MTESEATASCPSCGEETPAGAAFCPSCGARLDAGATERAELPASETGRVPVSVMQVEPRLFGVAPPTVLFGLAAVALTIGGFLVGLGHWVWALALFALAAILLVSFVRVARRKPDAAFARTSVEALDSILARAGFAARAVRTRSSARGEVLHLRAELLRLATHREELVRALGENAYRGERQSVKELKVELTELDGRAADLEAEIERVTEGARRTIRRAALEVQPTEIQPDSPPPTED